MAEASSANLSPPPNSVPALDLALVRWCRTYLSGATTMLYGMFATPTTGAAAIVPVLCTIRIRPLVCGPTHTFLGVPLNIMGITSEYA